MDTDGYPDENELKTIRDWPCTLYPDFLRLMEYVFKLWRYPEYRRTDAGVFYLSTAGWSGNEDIILALQANMMFWSNYWYSTKRGGHYVFCSHRTGMDLKIGW